MERDDLIWLAGFFDGDGSYRESPKGEIRITISQKNPKILYAIKRIMGFGKVSSFTGYQGNEYWRLLLNHTESLQFFRAIRPYMRTQKASELDALYSDTKIAL